MSFPMELDQAVMQIEDGWPAFIHNTGTIGDLTCWKDHDAYQEDMQIVFLCSAFLHQDNSSFVLLCHATQEANRAW